MSLNGLEGFHTISLIMLGIIMFVSIGLIINIIVNKKVNKSVGLIITVVGIVAGSFYWIFVY